jgi:hypothetical protein
MPAFGDNTNTMIESMADKNGKRTPVASRVCFGIQHVLYVKAVLFWVHKLRHEGIPVSTSDLNPDVIAQMVQKMNLECSMDASEDKDKVGQPAKFDPKKYMSWARMSFENYLNSLHGKLSVPLSYILCPKGANPAKAADDTSMFSGWHSSLDRLFVKIINMFIGFIKT